MEQMSCAEALKRKQNNLMVANVLGPSKKNKNKKTQKKRKKFSKGRRLGVSVLTKTNEPLSSVGLALCLLEAPPSRYIMAMTSQSSCFSMSNHTKERVTMAKVTLENFYSNLITQHEEREMR
ncbi:Serine/threonine-protein kinase 38 [Takifugu flavidus]|uniref:Serine/threonine-protein kinase 38 n=1 Tax=Takifugu flavidus TaxID=433684 RepID=A0A5C6MNM6_9TELE|nr:Serine/threonine-protein kinase 38 [Takifugu flavidus]